MVPRKEWTEKREKGTFPDAKVHLPALRITLMTTLQGVLYVTCYTVRLKHQGKYYYFPSLIIHLITSVLVPCGEWGFV